MCLTISFTAVFRVAAKFVLSDGNEIARGDSVLDESVL